MVAAQDDSSDEEDAKPVIKKPQENLDDFLDDFSAQPGDYEALWDPCASISSLPESVFVGPYDWYLLNVTFAISRFIFFRWRIESCKLWPNQPCEHGMKWGFLWNLLTHIKEVQREEKIPKMKINEKTLISYASSSAPCDREGWLLKRGEVQIILKKTIYK